MNTLIAILPNLSRHNHSDNSTLVGEDTVDEVLQKKKKTDRIFYIKGRKRNGGDENIETFANKGRSTRIYLRKGYRYASTVGCEKRTYVFFFFGTTVMTSSFVSSPTRVESSRVAQNGCSWSEIVM